MPEPEKQIDFLDPRGKDYQLQADRLRGMTGVDGIISTEMRSALTTQLRLIAHNHELDSLSPDALAKSVMEGLQSFFTMSEADIAEFIKKNRSVS